MEGAEFHLLIMSVQLKTINNVSIIELIKKILILEIPVTPKLKKF